MSPQLEIFKKFITLVQNDSTILKYTLGNNLSSNNRYLTNIEYDELSAIYTTMTIGRTVFYFNQDEIRELYAEKKFKIKRDPYILPIGCYNGSVPIYYDMHQDMVYKGDTKTEQNLIDYIIATILAKDSTLEEKYHKISVGKKYTYTRCKIIGRDIPLILFLAYNAGLTTVLHRANVQYELTDKRKILSPTEKHNIGCIPFKDKYLYYHLYPMKNSLLLNALVELPTTEYDYEMFNDKDVYLEIFYDRYNSRAIAKGFDNFYELFVDAITREVLEDLNYPTNTLDLLLYANELLQDNQCIIESDMSNYRIRSSEVVNVIFEKELEKAYITYKNSVNGATPIKMSLPQNAIIAALSNNTYGSILQDYDILNPIKELDKSSTVTYKGPGGLTLSSTAHLKRS
jgi:hypothetical protein